MTSSSTRHPVYGELLTRPRKLALFGEGGNSGIQHENGKVEWIMVKTGTGARWPNEVTATQIRYCYSPQHAANAAMKAAYESQERFLIKVVPDRGVNTYFWGEGVINTLKEEMPNGIERYVIDRVVAEEEEDLSPPSKRTRTATTTAKPQAIECFVEGVQFDSRLEARHATMMTALDMEWSRDAPTYHNILLGNGESVSYTPDFVVHLADGKVCVVEIKPCYPYDDEVRKCMAVCSQMRVTVCLLFNTSFTPPFAARKEGSGQGSYAHSEGVRGLAFEWIRGEGVRVRHDVAYAWEEESASIKPRETLGEDCFHHPRVMEAYRKASEIFL